MAGHETVVVDEHGTAFRRRWWALAVVCLAMFMAVLDSTSVYAALPSLSADLGFAPAEVQWVITAFGAAVGGLLLLGGRLADHLGRRRMFVCAVAVFGAASLLCGLAWSGEMLIAGRVLQGVSAAVMMPAGLSILMTVFPAGPERNKALGIWGGLGGTGASAGLLLGGALTDLAGWAWIFLTNVPVCLAVVALCPVLIPESRGNGQRLDLPGAIAATTGLVFLLLGLFRVAERGFDGGVSAFLAAALVAGVAFVLVERNSSAPLVPMRIFSSRTLVGGNLVVIIAGIAVDGLLIIVTLYAQSVLGFSALQYGVTMAIMTATSVIGVMLGQHLVSRSGFRLVGSGGLILMTLAFLALSGVSAEGTLIRDLLPGLVIFGAGMGAAFVAGQIAALADVTERDSGLAAGIEETSFTLGSTIGAALASAIAIGSANRGATTAPSAVDLTAGFSLAFFVLAALTTAGVALAALLLRPVVRITEPTSGRPG